MGLCGVNAVRAEYGRVFGFHAETETRDITHHNAFVTQ